MSNGRNATLWQRISEGRQLDELWSQFTADARASYGFYGKDVDWDEINKLPRWRRPFHIVKEIFWALLMKLTPARRVLLIVALALLLLSGFQFQYGDRFSMQVKFDAVAALIFLLLLSLELADKVTMKRDLEIAREIQTWLVPSDPPNVAGATVAFATRPQNSVAGDYYDAFYPTAARETAGKLSLVIADVAGKSVPAALLMATFQASLHTIAGEGVALDALVPRLNRYACAHSLQGLRFTTAVLAEYDVPSRTVNYVNAGHNAPVVRRKNGGIERLDSGSVPLGIHSQAAFQSARIELFPGDALVLFTDGVVEAFNESGQEFGDVRWVEAVRNLPDGNAQQSLQFLMKRVDEFVGATRQFDDITCLVLRCA